MSTQTGSSGFARIAGALRDYANNPSAYLTLNQGNAYLCMPDISAVVVYREGGRYWMQFGGPFAASGNRQVLLQAFLDRAN
jgi:lysylphosphatidylglycerol synthetase-like protein (DUF2156 family)